MWTCPRFWIERVVSTTPVMAPLSTTVGPAPLLPPTSLASSGPCLAAGILGGMGRHSGCVEMWGSIRRRESGRGAVFGWACAEFWAEQAQAVAAPGGMCARGEYRGSICRIKEEDGRATASPELEEDRRAVAFLREATSERGPRGTSAASRKQPRTSFLRVPTGRRDVEQQPTTFNGGGDRPVSELSEAQPRLRSRGRSGASVSFGGEPTPASSCDRFGEFMRSI
jgi:hypothetical protein